MWQGCGPSEASLVLVSVAMEKAGKHLYTSGGDLGMEEAVFFASSTSALKSAPKLWILARWWTACSGPGFGATLDGSDLLLNGAWRTNENAQP